MRQPPGMRPPSRPAAGTRVISAGPMSLVTDAPTLPAPNVPSANPCFCRLAHAAFQAMPTENELPATPSSSAQIIRPPKVVARETRKQGIAVAISSAMKRRRPPTRSVRIPKGRRQIDPLSTAIAVSQENWILSRCSSSLIGTLSTPNINQTANSNVNDTVDRIRTRVASLSRAVRAGSP